MKRILLVLAAASIVASATACSKKTDKTSDEIEIPEDVIPEIEEEADDPAADINGTFNYASLKEQGHPRLLMSRSDFRDLKIKLATDKTSALAKVNAQILKNADSYVANTPVVEYKLDASNLRLLQQSRVALKVIFHCAYAYRVTGQEKYLAPAVNTLKTVCSFKNWQPNWPGSPHFLDVAEMALGVAIGYDWLYYELDLETRTLIHKALKEYALEPAKSNPNNYQKLYSNWNQVCYAGLVSAGIVLYEKDKEISAAIVEEAIKNNLPAIRSIYNPDGAYPEGYGYWGYGTEFEMILLAELQQAFGSTAGLADLESFKGTGKYMQFMAGTVGMCFPYSDCNTEETGHFAQWWFADYFQDPSFVAREIRLIDELPSYPNSDTQRILPILPCITKHLDFENLQAEAPSEHLWSGRGSNPVILIHTRWDYSEDDKYLGIKGGKAGQNHGHMDAGSFVYDAYGVRWSEDLGHQSYTSIETQMPGFNSASQDAGRWKVYRWNNLAHSTLTVNDSDHRVDGVASISEVYDFDEILGGKLNMTSVLRNELASATRSFMLNDNKVLTITDQLTALDSKDAVVQWRMMTSAKVTVQNDCEVLELGGKTLYLKAGSSESSIPVNYTTWEARRPDSWPEFTLDADNSDKTVAGYTVTIPAGKSVTLTTILTPER